MDEYDFDEKPQTTNVEPDTGMEREASEVVENAVKSRPPSKPSAYIAPSFTDPTKRDGTGIAWVRASDLLSTGTARIAGRGIDFEAELARRMHGVPATARRVAQSRADRLPPLSEFGRTVDSSPLTTRTLGRR